LPVSSQTEPYYERHRDAIFYADRELEWDAQPYFVAECHPHTVLNAEPVDHADADSD